MRSEVLTWVGGEHPFALTLPLLEALQDRCGGDGVGLIHQRLVTQQYQVSDIIATLALGLEGGGMEKRESNKMVRLLFEDHGLTELLMPALAVLGAALQGWPEQMEKPEAEAEANS